MVSEKIKDRMKESMARLQPKNQAGAPKFISHELQSFYSPNLKLELGGRWHRLKPSLVARSVVNPTFSAHFPLVLRIQLYQI